MFFWPIWRIIANSGYPTFRIFYHADNVFSLYVYIFMLLKKCVSAIDAWQAVRYNPKKYIRVYLTELNEDLKNDLTFSLIQLRHLLFFLLGIYVSPQNLNKQTQNLWSSQLIVRDRQILLPHEKQTLDLV